jgi:hypothetical protein
VDTLCQKVDIIFSLFLTERFTDTFVVLSLAFPGRDWSFVNTTYKHIPEQRRVFDQIARRLGLSEFDQWYKVKLKDVKDTNIEGISAILYYYSNSLRKGRPLF